MSDSEDRSSLFGELKRMAKTSGAVGGIAMRVAGNRMGFKSGGSQHAEDLRIILGGLKGPMMKVAQFLSTIPEGIPEEYAQELSQLQANAPSMGAAFVRRRMQGELGADWARRFGTFDLNAAAAASLGQVHRATLPDGQNVACKLQYPDMPSTMEADLRQLRMAMAVFRRMDDSIQTEDIYAELADRLREELDYTREAAQMRLYGIMLRDTPTVHVPEPVEGLCTKRLVTMTWLEGRPLLKRLEENPTLEERNRTAEALFRAWYLPFYRYGVIHGDPHLGNYQVRADGSVNLLDYGAIRVFPATFVRNVIDLYEAIREKDREKSHHAYKQWGFENLTNETMDILNIWAGFLFEPLLDDRVRRITEVEDPTFGRSVAKKVHEGLRRTGGVKPPREFVLMDRSAIGLGSVFFRLKAEINWFRLFHELIDDFRTDTVAARQRAALDEAGVPESL